MWCPGCKVAQRIGCRCPSGWYEPDKGRCAEDSRELPGLSSVGFVHKLRHSRRACAVHGDEKIQLSFGCLDYGNIEVKKPDSVAFEALSLLFFPLNVRQARNSVTLKIAM